MPARMMITFWWLNAFESYCSFHDHLKLSNSFAQSSIELYHTQGSSHFEYSFCVCRASSPQMILFQKFFCVE